MVGVLAGRGIKGQLEQRDWAEVRPWGSVEWVCSRACDMALSGPGARPVPLLLEGREPQEGGGAVSRWREAQRVFAG